MLHPALRARVEVFTARNAALTRHRLQRITHIVVGDHPPERIINHDECAGEPGTTVDQCRGAACKAHNRCCWQ